MRMRLIFAAALLLIFTVGILLTVKMERTAREDFEKDSRNEALLLYGRFAANIESVDHAVLAMGGSPGLHGALTSNRELYRARANAVLDRYQTSMDASVCYVLNAQGLTVASSNRNAADSFLNKSFAFRPYFTEAIAGRTGRYLARGSVSNKRGYYASAPVRDNAGRIIGVAVIKKDLDALEEVFRKWPVSFLASPDGIVFLASEPRLVFRSLWPAAADRRDELATSRQFGELNFEPVMQQAPADAAYLKYHNDTRYVVRLPLPIPGWSILYLRDPHEIANYRLLGVLSTLFVVLLALFGYVALARAEERRRTAEKRLQAEEIWSRTFDAVGDLIAIIGADHRIIRVNQAMARRLEMKPEDVIGRNCYELMHGTEGPIESCPLETMLGTGECCAVEAAEARLGGEFSITASPLRGPGGTVEGSVHVMHDITEQRKRERQILLKGCDLGNTHLDLLRLFFSCRPLLFHKAGLHCKLRHSRTNTESNHRGDNAKFGQRFLDHACRLIDRPLIGTSVLVCQQNIEGGQTRITLARLGWFFILIISKFQ